MPQKIASIAVIILINVSMFGVPISASILAKAIKIIDPIILAIINMMLPNEFNFLFIFLSNLKINDSE